VASRSKLFEPLRIRGLELANRFVMSPMNRNAAPNGIPGENLAQFYRRRVDGEVGLIVTGGIGIDHPAAIGVYEDRPCNVPLLAGEAAREGWRRIVELVHAGGGRIAAQLWHQGPMRTEVTGYHPDAPSCRPSGIWGPVDRPNRLDPAFVARLRPPTRALRDDEIVELVDAYARSARAAAEVGFDAVELHGGNGYLIYAFLSADTNQRTDRWGGDRRRRATFAVEVAKAVRRAVGEQLPILFRLSQICHEDLDGRLAEGPDELAELLEPIAEAGVDVFNASEFAFDAPAFAGSELNLAGWAKKLTGRPSITVGSVGLSHGIYDDARGPAVSCDNLDAIVRRFERGEFDLVGVGRSLLQDPAWVHKARLGLPFEPYSDAALRTVV